MSCFPLLNGAPTTVGFSAKWIAPRGAKPDNYTFLARKAFGVSQIPPQAVLRISADSRYVVYLSGQCIGAGPVRGTDRRMFFDSYDVSAALHKGVNYVAVEVHCPVRPVTMMVPPVTPAVWMAIPGLVQTDASWQVRLDPCHRSDSLFYTHHIGYSDYRDLRLELAGWRTFEDGAPGWEEAEEVALGDELGGRVLVPRDIPALSDERYRAACVVGCGSVPTHSPGIEEDLEYAELIETEDHLAAAPHRFENIDALCKGKPMRVNPHEGGHGAFVIVDFQRELCGNLIMEVEGPAGAIMDVGYDETVEEGRIHPLQVNPNRSVYRYADRYILRSGRQRIENRLQDRGLRVLQLTFRRFTEPVTVHSLEIANRLYPSSVKATFECDRPFLNRLWEMACHTLTTCCSDLFMDCPWREQTLWIDDQPFENLYYLELTCDPAFAARNLRLGADGAMPDGMIPSRYPSTPGIYFRSMPALWTLILSDYHLYTGDTELVRELLPVMGKALSLYDHWRDEDGLVPYEEGEWNFIDWGYDLNGVTLGGKASALNLLIAGAYKRAAVLYDAVGNVVRAEEFSGLAKRTAQAVSQQFWLEEEGRFYDCTHPPDGRRTVSQIPHALGLHFGLLDFRQASAALEVLFSTEAIRAEYGYQLFVLRALAENGLARQALQAIHDLWGHIVHSDSPSLWEVSGGRSALLNGYIAAGSLCHGYACAPIDFIQRVLLGVKPLKPGFEEFALNPQSLGVLWVKGDVPTPCGCVHVEWSVEGGSLRMEAKIPEGTTAIAPNRQRLDAGSHRLEFAVGP